MTSSELAEALEGNNLKVEVEKIIAYCQGQAETAKGQAHRYEKTGGPRVRTTTMVEKRLQTATSNYAEARGEATAYRDVVAVLSGLLRKM